MRKWLYVLLCTMIPALALAADGSGSSLSFAPPAGDFSIVFLGNLFGMVDGVLHGTGSQIIGNMFGVFNAAVLAIGGVIMSYTVIVSTMNTAQEGQFLGQKWSSIWIPVRATIGLALVIPKVSGYSMMQIFVMWIVVQGVGAADKVWESALSYLNSGGVIIKAQQGSPVTNTGEATAIMTGAYTMLVGQVCMGVLERQLKTAREGYLNAAPMKLGGACDAEVIKNNPVMTNFCRNPVPNFMGSVNFIAAQEGAAPYSVKMPNFPSDSPYFALNGICGTIKWNRFGDLDNVPCKITPGGGAGAATPQSGCGLLSSSESDALSKARPIALSAMYNDLGNVAQIIINNIPFPVQTNNKLQPITKIPYSGVAQDQFGMPYTSKGKICEKYSDQCVGWGAASGGGNAPLFSNGAEFLYSILDYNAIMLPNLNLLQQLKDVNTADKTRQFIAQSNREGWIMAGSYFFDLVKLNGNAASNVGLTDKNSGLNSSILMRAEDISSAFNEKGCNPTASYGILCQWLGKADKIQPLLGVIDGTGYLTPKAAQPVFTPGNTSTVGGKDSSTVNGYVQNSVFIRLPGQPGIKQQNFARFPAIQLNTKIEPLPPVKFECGHVWLLGCFGQFLGDLFWNKAIMGIYGVFIAILGPIITSVVNTFVMIPLQTMSGIFVEGLKTLSLPGVNPVIALANMGAHYINAAGDLWINMLMLSISTSVIPVIGKFIFVLITLSMPIVIAWLGLMMGVGFVTAYYIPILPFLIFTFASIGWMIAVIEAMVAAPIVALGISHPEGHDAFGKGEQAVMILMNVFLRPAMMIIGYVTAIALCYVGVWLLNAGFLHAIGFVVGIPPETVPLASLTTPTNKSVFNQVASPTMYLAETSYVQNEYGYGNTWAGIYAFFFSILAYTSAYLTIVQKSFTLIHYLPDKVLRWIGGQPEGIGGETAGWADETKGQIKEGGDKTGAAQGKIGEKLGGSFEKGMDKLKDNAAKVATAGAGGVAEGAAATKKEPE